VNHTGPPLSLSIPGPIEDDLLAKLGRYPHAQARPVSSYGLDGWVVKM
jgi:hypothetical protein